MKAIEIACFEVSYFLYVPNVFATERSDCNLLLFKTLFTRIAEDRPNILPIIGTVLPRLTDPRLSGLVYSYLPYRYLISTYVLRWR